MKNCREKIEKLYWDWVAAVFLKFASIVEPLFDTNGEKVEPKSTFRPCNCSCHGDIVDGNHIRPCCYPELK